MKLYPGYFSTGIISFCVVCPVFTRLADMACASASSSELTVIEKEVRLIVSYNNLKIKSK